MKSNDLIDIIGEAADEHIRDAKSAKKKAMPRWAKWSSGIAACLVVALGINILFNNMGSESGSGGDSDLSYMAYYGPVLPLTIQGDSSGITAERSINFDFATYDGYQRGYGESKITDFYELKNETDENRTITLLYPFAGTMQQWEDYPTIAVDGTEVSMEMYPGPYSGGFEGVWGAKNQENGSVNIKSLDSFEGYQALLSTDDYLNSAFDTFPELNQTVYVYRLHDFVYSETTEDVNPTLSMDFYIDYEKTTVFSYGMNGASWDHESGYCSRRKGGIEYRPNASPEVRHPDDGYVILLGEDLESYTLQGYRDGGCDEGEELNDVSCTITRYETTLGEIMYDLLEVSRGDTIRQMESQLSGKIDVDGMPAADLYMGLAAELLYSYSPIGDAPKERYSTGMLEDIFSGVYTNRRVIYLSFDVTIPAGESVKVEVLQTKDASMDYVGKDKGKDGYDMATQLGSNLVFTGQTASISNYDAIEIVSQNFGFDLTGGITSVHLDLNELHYYLEVRGIDQTE